MLSTKTLATLLLFTLNMQLAASSGTQEPSPSSTSTLRVKKSKPKPTSKPVLKDETNTTEAVQAAEESTEGIVQAQELPVPQVNKKFDELLKQGKYDELFELGNKMKRGEFIKQLCSVVKTHEQYKGFVKYLKKHNMVALFYVCGDIGVVREAILTNSSIYKERSYVYDGDLETALPLALNNDCHNRFIELLNVRQEVTAEKDELLKRQRKWTSFESFVFYFHCYLAPWKDDMAPRRFLAHCEDKPGIKHSDIIDTFCEMLVQYLRIRLNEPESVSLLTDMIGQPSLLLTPVSFIKGFLTGDDDEDRSAFIKYGWAEVFQEGLKREYSWGGEDLWQAMKEERPDQLTEKFPENEEERADACKRFLTKKQKEVEWKGKRLALLSNKLKSLNILPEVLCPISIIAEYAVSLTITEDPTISGK